MTSLQPYPPARESGRCNFERNTRRRWIFIGMNSNFYVIGGKMEILSDMQGASVSLYISRSRTCIIMRNSPIMPVAPLHSRTFTRPVVVRNDHRVLITSARYILIPPLRLYYIVTPVRAAYCGIRNGCSFKSLGLNFESRGRYRVTILNASCTHAPPR